MNNRGRIAITQIMILVISIFAVTWMMGSVFANEAQKTPPAAPEPTKADSALKAAKLYTVVKGATLSGIAAKFRTTVEKLTGWNC